MPRCACGGYLAPWQVYSHVGLYEPDVQKAEEWASKADLVIVAGTRGNYGDVYWGNIRCDARIVQINPRRTAFSFRTDFDLRMSSDEAFDQLN